MGVPVGGFLVYFLCMSLLPPVGLINVKKYSTFFLYSLTGPHVIPILHFP